MMFKHLLLPISVAMTVIAVNVQFKDDTQEFISYCVMGKAYDGLRACFHSEDKDLHGRIKGASAVKGFMTETGNCEYQGRNF